MVTLEPLASQGAIRVTWSPPADLCGLTNPQYIIQYGVTLSSFTTHLSRPSSSPFTITGLTTGQQYFVRVAILGGAGYFSSWESVTIHEGLTAKSMCYSYAFIERHLHVVHTPSCATAVLCAYIKSHFVPYMYIQTYIRTSLCYSMLHKWSCFGSSKHACMDSYSKVN